MKEVNSLINIDGSSYEEIYSLLDCIKPKSKNQETDILTMKISDIVLRTIVSLFVAGAFN